MTLHPKLVIHEIRDKAHRLIVDEQKSNWCSRAEFAVIETAPGEGYAASPVLAIPKIFEYKSIWATIVEPTEIEPTLDEDLPTL